MLPIPEFVVPGMQATLLSRIRQAIWWMTYDNKDAVLKNFRLMENAFCGLAKVTSHRSLKHLYEITYHHFALELAEFDLVFILGLRYETKKGVVALITKADFRTVLARWDANFPFKTDFEVGWIQLLSQSPLLLAELQHRYTLQSQPRTNFDPVM